MSSKRRREQHLADILENIELIETFRKGREAKDYLTDIFFRSAIERRLEIIAEAAYRLGEEASQVDPGHDWRGLKALGNVLRHAYHRIDDEAMWRVVTDDLPVLKASVEAALKT